ncbi:unnamed protein product [Blepharisma stoltei]|uniref:Tyrosine-protein kinase ephrin type A/B receptor-like domain-containing protein n=1 Tax=Blepharisma stoltei TaxID=1481888 RepID=A0AAU9IDJ2_9CILI|nr:unnamed protein product [Blepharisma stoltei]
MTKVLLLCLSTWVFSLEISLIPPTGVPPPNSVLGHMVYDTTNNQLIQFGGMQTGGSYLNDLASFNLSQKRWSLISPYVSTVPDERAAGALFYHQKSQKLLLYGGRTRAGPAGDFWSYDLNENSWEKLDKNGDDPGARGYIVLTTYTRNGSTSFAIFGGLSSTGVDNSLYILDGESLFWSKKPNSGNSPQPQESSGIAYYKDKLYVWGGLSRFSTIIHDTALYEYDLAKEEWKKIEINGKKPGGRFEHFLCFVEDYLYVYLGVDFETGLTIFDIWKINLISLDTWIEVNFKDPSSTATGSGSLTFVSSVLWSFAGYSDTGINNSIISLEFSLETPIINLISPEMTGPTARMFHSLQTIQTNLWVFGGIDNDKNYLNEMWKFDILASDWSIMNPTGDIPSVRAKHASCAIADTLTIFGGENSSGYLSDMYEYTVLSNTWKTVLYGSDIKPVGRAGACMAIADSTIYIFGGLVVGGYSNELWQFNTIDNTFTLLDDGLSERVPKLAYSKCFMRNIDSNYYFYITTGEGEDEYPNSKIHRYDISGQEWLPVLDKGYGYFSLAQAAVVNIDNYIIVIGGEQWNFKAFDTIYMVDLDVNPPNHTLIGHLEEAIYATEVTYFQNSIYLFGGGDTLSSLVQNFIAKRFLFKTSIEKTDDLSWSCSNGTYGDNCDLCPEGYYSDTFGAETCKACPKGTYNKFSAARTLVSAILVNMTVMQKMKGLIYVIAALPAIFVL